jgi:transmembrane sensor
VDRKRSKVDNQIREEACEWFIECRAGDLDSSARKELDGWLRKSPEHLHAYLEIAAIWNEGPALDPEHKYDVDSLIAQATEEHDNVVSLPGAVPTAPQTAAYAVREPPPAAAATYVAVPAAPPIASMPARRRRIRFSTIAASVAIFAAATGAALWIDALRSPTYATAIGEQRSLVLADGSTVSLNSRSKIRVRYSKTARDVELLDGQALFHVAKDAARPFIVKSGETQVRAVGTEFDVYKKEEGTVVTVVEGRVAVVTDEPLANTELSGSPQQFSDSGSAPSLPFPATPEGQPANIFVSAGEQLSVTHQAIKKADHANVATATAWTQRQLVFESASLTDVAQEFNRYNQRQLILEDKDLDTFHISGVFSSTDPASLIRFLEARPGLRVVETSSEIRIERLL